MKSIGFTIKHTAPKVYGIYRGDELITTATTREDAEQVVKATAEYQASRYTPDFPKAPGPWNKK